MYAIRSYYEAAGVRPAQHACRSPAGRRRRDPRGTAPPYGMMGWETGTQFLTDNATLVHLGWSTYITPQQFVDNINRGKELGIPKYLVATSGPQMESESFWKDVRDMGVTDNDFYGVYFPDEEGSPRITSYNVCYTKLLRISE